MNQSKYKLLFIDSDVIVKEKRILYLPKYINPIIKLTEQCNYSCSFCRYSQHRQRDFGIPEQLVIKLILECYAYNRTNGIRNMNVIFHGGEPLLYGKDRLSTILEKIEKEIPKDFSIEYSIQTNSSLLSDSWIDLFKEYNFDVGISLDGPIQVNGHYGINKESSVDNAVSAYHLLKDNGIDCGFLSVITNEHLNELNGFFEFFIDNEIESVGLCYCYNKFDGDSVDPTMLGKWLVGLYELYFNASRRINIREFDLISRRVLNHPHNACSMSCRESCGSYITITPDGNVEFCDDYDLDEGRVNSLGNLNCQSLLQILKESKYQIMKKQSMEILQQKCTSCEVFDLCRCGCSRNDNNGNNFFCDTYKILYPYIQNRILNYLKEQDR